MSDQFDIVVVGTGPGGYIAALKAAQMGAKTAVIEKKEFVGGTCLNWGCIPSKALLATAQRLHEIRHADALGISIGGEVTFDWAKVQKRKDQVLRGLRGGIQSLFKARAVELVKGKAILEAPGRLVVESADGKPARTLTANKIILATGSEPTVFGGWPADREFVCTSDEALHWATLPKKLLIVGGGVIGCEFACMMQPLGVEVTVVELMPALLPGLDGHIAEALLKALSARGIKIHLATKVEDMQVKDGGVASRLSNGETLQTDRVLVAVGRRPNTAGIGLENLGLATERGFLRVNDKMETPLADHYCIGDANGRIQLAHAASAQGVVAVENALGHDRVFDAPVPGCVYTFPEIGVVGLTQESAREKGIPIFIGSFPIGHLGKAMAVGDTEGFVKVIRHRQTRELLGVHMIGHNATEVIQTASTLMHQKVEVKELAEAVMAHPTIAEALKEAAEDALSQALHLPPKQVMRVTVGGDAKK